MKIIHPIDEALLVFQDLELVGQLWLLRLTEGDILMDDSPQRRVTIWKVLLVLIAVIAGAFYFLWPAPPAIDMATAESLGTITDGWWSSRSSEDVRDWIEPSDWPPEIRRFTPKSVRFGRDGVYIKLQSLFVMQWGLFVLPTGSTFKPTDRGDPSYRHLQGRVYWYKIDG